MPGCAGHTWVAHGKPCNACRPDKERFHRPYKHAMTVPGSDASITLSIRQKKFGPEGFASTVRAAARWMASLLDYDCRIQWVVQAGCLLFVMLVFAHGQLRWHKQRIQHLKFRCDQAGNCTMLPVPTFTCHPSLNSTHSTCLSYGCCSRCGTVPLWQPSMQRSGRSCLQESAAATSAPDADL